MTTRGDVWAILVAAGSGARFGGDKHMAELDGLPLWAHADSALREGGVTEVVIVGDQPGWVAGGERRRDSVANGLAHVPEAVPFVLVHDAARPMASAELVRRVIERLRSGDAAGVVPAVPVRDTLKQTQEDAVVVTVDRSSLVAVQTPQGFRSEVLRRAHAAGDGDATDDAMLLESIGETVVTVPGEPNNLKITFPEDLELAASVWASRRG
jgi:2-C-methyl-D-erythritol 4-phosphate cytidylyltransferase